METLLKKFYGKLMREALSIEDRTIMLAVDDRIYELAGNRTVPYRKAMLEVINNMNINSLLFGEPAEPYRSILKELLGYAVEFQQHGAVIVPEDCETRTFFHDIPVIESFDAEQIISALSIRKSAIVSNPLGIVSYGSISPEQAYVSYSSTCFSTFVKYFYDLLQGHALITDDSLKEAKKILSSVHPLQRDICLEDRPLRDRKDLIEMIIQAGMALVQTRLVDSFFGNISALYNDYIYISETACCLDELRGAIDEVPIKGGSTAAITASSELPTHRQIYVDTEYRFILHGHPRFTVVMSMYCEKNCDNGKDCYRRCPEEIKLCGVPVVPGEIGTGPTGIVNTVPAALKNSDAVVVRGHGVFTAARDGFSRAFRRMVEIEICSKLRYYELLRSKYNEDFESSPCPDQHYSGGHRG